MDGQRPLPYPPSTALPFAEGRKGLDLCSRQKCNGWKRPLLYPLQWPCPLAEREMGRVRVEEGLNNAFLILITYIEYFLIHVYDK